MTASKTKLTPSEFADAIMGIRHEVEAFRVYVEAPAATKTYGVFIADVACKVRSVKARMTTCGTAGNPSEILVKKNGTTVLASALTIAHDATDGAVKHGVLSATEADLQLAPGDVLTIGTDDDIATNAAGLAVQVMIDRDFAN